MEESSRNKYSELSLAELYLLMKEVAEAYVERASQARENLSIVSKEIDKVEHKIETSCANVAGGYSFYKELRELRRIRRLIKYDIFTDDLVKEHDVDIRTMRNLLNKPVRHYQFSEKCRENNREYLNMDKLGEIDWQSVTECVNRILPKVDKNELYRLKEKLENVG